MVKKGQKVSVDGQELSAAEQCYVLALKPGQNSHTAGERNRNQTPVTRLMHGESAGRMPKETIARESSRWHKPP